VSFALPRCLSSRLVVVLLIGVLAAGGLSASARADTPAAPGRVSGLILDRSNQPLAGATITFTDGAGTTAGATDTDGQGRWSLSVPQGDYDLAVIASQGGRTLAAKVRRYTVETDTKLNLIVAGEPDVRVAAAAAPVPDEPLSPAYTRAAAATAQSSTETVTFSGQVLDPDGDPTRHNVSVQLTGADYPYLVAEVFVSGDDDGTFSLDVPAGTYSLRVETGAEDPDDCPGCPEYRGDEAHSFFVNSFQLDGDRQEAIRLPRPAVLTVTVVDPSNQPVPWAWVTSTSSWNEPLASPLALFPGATVTDVSSAIDILTGNDGTAAVEYFPGSGPATISVEPPAGTQLPTETAVPLNATSLTIQVQDGPTLHGRLFQADGNPISTGAGGYISGTGGSYPVAVTPDGYAVTAPPGRYQMYLEVSHEEEGESSDYWIWELQTGDFDIVGDQRLDLNVPLGLARLWVVDDKGQRLDRVYASGMEATSDITIGGGIRATTRTNSSSWPDHDEYLVVIGPSLTEEINEIEDYGGAPASAYVAPGEHTIIAFIAGTGPGYDPLPETTTTTTTTTRPTTTTTTAPVATNDPPAGPASEPGTSTGSGYWALSSDGTVHHFGAASQLGNGPTGAVDIEPTPTGNGYWILNKNGRVQGFGDAAKLGDVDLATLAKGETPASLSAAPTGKGYWVFTSRGRAIAFGDAPFLGDVSDVTLNGPVLGSVATPSGRGYYMVASDGGIFTFGDAVFLGSMGGQKLNAPVQSLVPDADGKGYWLVANDGGIFAFDAPFRGSLGAITLNKPVVGMVRYGDGYLMVGADGGIFNFSSLPFSGSLGDRPPATPVVAVAATGGS
jgi:hypothetical protein